MSKYTGLGTMNFGGALRPFHVDSLRQTEKFCETMGIELDEYYTHLANVLAGDFLKNKKRTIIFIWSSLWAGAIKVNRRCDFDYEDVLDWYEDAQEDPAQANEIVKPLQMLYLMSEDRRNLLEAQKKSESITIQDIEQAEKTMTLNAKEKVMLDKMKQAFG